MPVPARQPDDILDDLRPFAREEWVVVMRPGGWVALLGGQARKILSVEEAKAIWGVINLPGGKRGSEDSEIAPNVFFCRFPGGEWFLFEPIPVSGTYEFHGLVLDQKYGDEIYQSLYQKLQLRRGKTYVEFLERLKRVGN